MHLGGLGRIGDGLKSQCIRRGLLFNGLAIFLVGRGLKIDGLDRVGDGLENNLRWKTA